MKRSSAVYFLFSKAGKFKTGMARVPYNKLLTNQPRSQDLFPSLGAGREKALASAGHVPTLHPEILGVIN